MRIELGPRVRGSLLGSCRFQCNVELAERTSKRLFKLEPTKVGNYVLLADVYAEANMWDEFNQQFKELHALLLTLSNDMKEKGYVPQTKVVLYDLDEKEKERIVLARPQRKN
ncbi:hypothetical protein JRO89_XS03G0030400 [Xanthoceras sorbifolium]|uniref:Stimulator of interferon genes protein n=1 Tax=Xanthoceras sorbifolium TaxID=99658 RepID=A0ABQ8I8F0_9ROSI|nr:hypothetical protein JRO89_XS03G0030400 [Xanthoceras sorbifolium]